MALPNQPSIELPLLLELERSGGLVRRDSSFPIFFDRVANHFPAITREDRNTLRQDGKTRVFDNSVDWARNSLRTKAQLNGGQSGVWEITAEGRLRLERDLINLGISEVSAFIKSERLLSEAAGTLWAPKPLRVRGAGPILSADAGDIQESSVVSLPEVIQASVATPLTTSIPSETSHEEERSVHDELLAQLRSLSPVQFEHLIGEYLKAKGLSNVHVTGRTGDGGIDGDGELPFLELRCAFQAKCYAEGNPVGAGPIRNFKGGVVGRYDRGIFITTSSFTPGAREEVDQPGVSIILIDGDELVTQLADLGLGVRTVPVVRRSIDTEFFNSLGR